MGLRITTAVLAASLTALTAAPGPDAATAIAAEATASPAPLHYQPPVAGTRAVTVLHPDGLRSSYTGLATVTATAGEDVAGGEAIGTSGDRLHLGVRSGDAYLDPATLFGTGARAHLVPVHSPADTRAGPTTVGP